MKLNGLITLKGQINFRHYRDGKLLSEETIDNTITTVGIREVAGLINEVTSGGFKWIGLGSSSTSAVAANTDLAAVITAAGLARAAATCTRTITTTANDTAQLVHTFTATATQAVREAAIFDASTSGIMLARQTFAAKNMESSDTLVVTYKTKVA
jgi:hypothetical protein